MNNSATFTAGDSAGDLAIGYGNISGTGGTATATVTSDGYVKSLSGVVVGAGGDTGTLNISGGGTVEATNRIFVGLTNTISSGTEVGGTGIVNIGAGGTLLADGDNITAAGFGAISVGHGSGSMGTINVSGTGALLDSFDNPISVGVDGGAGTVTVSDGGTVDVGTQFAADAAASIGDSGGDGLLTVTGSLSTFTADGQLDVGVSALNGSAGFGSLDVENGGTVITGNNPVFAQGGFVIAWGTGSTGSVTVDGAGSEIENTGQFNVGGSGNSGAPAGGVGTLLIEDGGLVQTGLPTTGYTGPAADIAADPDTGGSSVTVTGADSTWAVSGALLVGDAAAGTLTIAAGGTVTAQTTEAGVRAGSDGVITMTGGTLDVSGAATIGVSGSAALNIDAGSTVAAASLSVGTLGEVSLADGDLDVPSITNAGTISGYGSVSAAITNTGLIDADGGALALSGAITGTGTLSASDADLVLSGAVSNGQTFDFADATSTLTLSDFGAFGGTIEGFQAGDSILVAGASSGALSGNTLTLYDGVTELGTIDFASVPSNILVSAGEVEITPCFLAGTCIRAEHGEIPVEQLAAGDSVLTLSGVLRPIKWLGYRSYRRPFVGDSADIVPIRIKAGALAEGVPARDLCVSPLHAMLLDDVLIPAGLLVNDVTILSCPEIEAIDYIHVELDTHDVILAEGAPAETFVDCDSRAMFHNAADFARRYPADTAPGWVFCAPRVTEGLALRRIRARLADRAGLPPAPRDQGGRLLGYIDVVTHTRISGWAWQEDHPRSPAVLEILVGDGVIARVTADIPRLDVRDAGFGDGLCGFDLTLAQGLLPSAGHEIQVRRAADGAALPGSPRRLQPVRPPSEAEMADALCASGGTAALDDAIGRMRAARWQRLAADSNLVPLRPATRLGLRPRALVIDLTQPRLNRDAGSNAVLSHMRALLHLGYQVEFVATRELDAPAGPALGDLGVICHHAPGVSSVEDVLRHGDPDLIYLHRAEVAGAYAALARLHCPGARLLYAVADLHHLRLARQATVERRPDLLARTQAMRNLELFAISQADVVITHSPAEAAYLARVAPAAAVHMVPWAVTTTTGAAAHAERSGIGFVGWHGHAPNADAVRWLLEEIMPLVWARHPDITCSIIGEGWPERLPRLDARVRAAGRVERLPDMLGQSRLTVAPLRFGAGLKGKVLDSLAAGVPCVMTPVAAEGFVLPPALGALVSADPAQLAAGIIRLHEDAAANAFAASAGLALVDTAFTEARVAAALGQAVAWPEPEARKRLA